MNHNDHKQIKNDCREFLRTAIFVSFLHRLTNIASPTIAAWLIGDMTNHLLNLDVVAILSSMPSFLCAVFFQVIVVSIFNLVLNLLLTKQGFAYDSYLMEKFIHLPLSTVQTVDAGSVMERLEEDSAAFCWNQMTVCAYPCAIIVFALVLGYILFDNGCHIIFALTIVLLAALPIVRTAYIGKAQTSLKKKVSEYNDARKQMEQELFNARDFAQSYSLHNYFINRLDILFHSFLNKVGLTQYRMNAKTETLDFLCNYGVQLCAVLMGALLISLGKLTLGTLLSGYLMIPAITQCFQYVREWITEKHDESKYLSRIRLFYSSYEERESSSNTLTSLDASNITFTYSTNETPVISDLHFHMSNQENWRLIGSNGSGKSTLMSILAGLYDPQSGQVCFGASVGQRRKSVALQDQDGAIFSGTIWDNLFIPSDKQKQAKKMLSDMGMEKSMDYEVLSGGSNLSPGEKKKILLTRALLRDAEFLLLDEPMNHLDKHGINVLRHALSQRSGGLLLISHQDTICDSLDIHTFDMDLFSIHPSPTVSASDS